MVLICSYFYEQQTIDKQIITEEQQKAAQYAKAMGHPICIVLELLSNQSCSVITAI